MASMVASGIYQFSMEEVIGLLTEVVNLSSKNGRKEMIQLENVHKVTGKPRF